jgi:hypothetical protein
MNTDEIKRAFIRLYNQSLPADRNRARAATPSSKPAPAKVVEESAPAAEFETSAPMERVHTQSSISEAPSMRVSETPPSSRGYETPQSRTETAPPPASRSAGPAWLEPFEPIGDQERVKPAFEPARAFNRLQLPYVVRQVLDQATTSWERFAEAIYSRC